MFKSLFAKLTLVLLLLFTLLSILTVSITLFSSDLYQQEVMQKLNSKVAEHIVNETNILKNDQVDHASLSKLFHNLMVLNPSLEIYLVDHLGKILAFSAPPSKVIRLSIDVEPMKRYLSAQTILPIRGDDPRDASRSKVFSVASVPFENKANGYLYIIIGGEQYDSITEKIKNSYILTNSFSATFIGLLFVFLVGIILFSSQTKRLKKLANAITDFKKNPQTPPVFPVFKSQGDEIDQLTAAFQTMALKIHQQLDDIQTTDNLRRELVANVSHDLRSPLATLHGYIETLLIKESTLSEEQRKSYLQTAMKHCSQLNTLVAELFELARLDACETKPHREVFNLVELIEDVTQKFKFSSAQKQIQLSTDYQSTSLIVVADISLIERVLENLLENALNFVLPGGMITIVLVENNQHIQVQVIDNGLGIPNTELPLIFDRFYQLDKNRNVENGGCGLGLAIVKRILELHNSIINVSSIPGQKTTFSFTLPVSSDLN